MKAHFAGIKTWEVNAQLDLDFFVLNSSQFGKIFNPQRQFKSCSLSNYCRNTDFSQKGLYIVFYLIYSNWCNQL